MALIISIVRARITKMELSFCLDKDTEQLEDKIVLNAFMLKIDSESVKSNVILLAKLKVALMVYTKQRAWRVESRIVVLRDEVLLFLESKDEKNITFVYEKNRR